MKLHRGNIDQFRRAIADHGWHVKKCSHDHWQITNALAKPVNLHWDKKNALTVYVSGAVCGTPVRSTIEAVITFIAGGMKVCSKRVGRVNTSKVKQRMWLAGQRSCVWCGVKLTLDEATIDHLIPLSKGGSNRADNMCIACDSCNKSRGDSMRPLEVWRPELLCATC